MLALCVSCFKMCLLKHHMWLWLSLDGCLTARLMIADPCAVFAYTVCSLLSSSLLSPCPGHRTPPARSGHRCVADNTNLYVFGGYNPDYDESGGSENEDYPLFRELWRYHFATGCWQQIRTEGYMPTELASMSGIIVYHSLMPKCLHFYTCTNSRFEGY